MSEEFISKSKTHSPEDKLGHSMIQHGTPFIKDLIYTIRGQQVMLDSDLAFLFGVETRRLNENVKRNIDRFPEEFRFQLTAEEASDLMSQIATSSFRDGYGGRRKLPYVFTEQGVAMLSAVLRSETAVQTSIAIMNAFVQMRRFLADNAGLLQRMDVMETRQLEYQRHTDERFDQVLNCLEARGAQEATQKIFFDGQIYDAFELLTKLANKAEKEIVLIDSYIDLETLNVLAKKRKAVKVSIFTTKRGNKLTEADIEKFNAQYPRLEVSATDAFHDRFIILDETDGYHIGASIKDAGKKCFGINRIEDKLIVEGLLEHLEV